MQKPLAPMGAAELAKRRGEMLRRRLAQHTQQEGVFVPRHVSTRARADGEQQRAARASEAAARATEEEAAAAAAAAEDDGSSESDSEGGSEGGDRRHRRAEAEEAAEEETESLDVLRERWAAEQTSMADRLALRDEFDLESTKLVAGVDVSFVKGTDQGVCSLSVIDFETGAVVASVSVPYLCRYPYICGYFTYRELPGIRLALQELKNKRPDLTIDVIIVDGNGVLHHRGCGLACHVSVETGIPAFGIAKSLLCHDGLDAMSVEERLDEESLGGHVDLWGNSGRVWGEALRTTQHGKPIYVSAGNLISRETAVEIALHFWRMEEYPQRYVLFPFKLKKRHKYIEIK